ncbi:MAG: PAC2 family protein [Dehalococcoidales bacterium]|jgi:proteasome assembly chaperone (PAC2) family protein
MNSHDNLIYNSKPALRKPYIICGLNGFFNGGNVSAGGVSYFINQFKAVKFAEIPAPRYHIYQIPGIESLRPVFKMEEGLIVESLLPTNQFYYATNPASEHDLILFLGNEPSLYWEEYAETIVDLARDFGAARLYSMCGILDMTPYTREPLISCTCTGAKVKQEIDDCQVTFSNREGMASFGQMLIYICKKKGLEGVNFTVRVPCYPEFSIFLGESPKSLKAILIRLKDLIHYDVNFDKLDSVIEEIEEKLNSVRQQNPSFNSFMEELEKKYVEMPYRKSLDISPSDGVRLAEEFLKNNED